MQKTNLPCSSPPAASRALSFSHVRCASIAGRACPAIQAGSRWANGLRPVVRLATGCGQLSSVGDQVGDQLADVVGQVDVFGEAVHDLVELR
jgi:hypothetical protein